VASMQPLPQHAWPARQPSPPGQQTSPGGMQTPAPQHELSDGQHTSVGVSGRGLRLALWDFGGGKGGALTWAQGGTDGA
jgi:hypothetical protein